MSSRTSIRSVEEEEEDSETAVGTASENNQGPTTYGTVDKAGVIQGVADVLSNEEQVPLLGSQRKSTTPTGVVGVLLILLLGESAPLNAIIIRRQQKLIAIEKAEFIASADATLIFASGATIASDFKSFDSVNWLSIAYTMGVCACQPTMGKLSDIYGRKPILLAACLLFSGGCLMCGLGTSMNQVIIGRAITGVGGGGLMSMASLIIADVVNIRELAVWRSYDNVSQTIGRSLGGPLGGLLTDSLSWRWSLYIQIPFMVLAAALVFWKLQLPRKIHNADNEEVSAIKKLRRVDFPGAVAFAGAIITATFLLDMGSQRGALNPDLIGGLAAVSAVLFISFVLVEAYVAKEPIFLLRLLRNKDVILSYAAMGSQLVAQVTLMFFVPLYFQITQRASPTIAGLHLVPAVVGNAVGGLLAGAWIKRTGRFKLTAVLGGIVACTTYILLIFRWNGNTGPLESVYIIPGGFGTSLVLTATFLSMTAAVKKEELAMSTSGLFLVMHVSFLGGMTTANSILVSGFRSELNDRLTVPNAAQIIEQAIPDTSYINRLSGVVHQSVAYCYVSALRKTYYISLAASLTSSVFAMFLTNRQL